MTRIARIGPGAQPTRRTARAAGGFALPEEAAAEAMAPTPAVGVAALLAMQEQRPVAAPGERAARRGGAMLDELRGMQLDLLRGAADPARLERLASLSGAAAAAEPALAAILAEIATRARVELARHRAGLRQRSERLPGRSASAM